MLIDSNSAFSIRDIKLIIWDLDNTFWEGTISEGDICIPTQKAELIKELSRRGIVNSICSKNDFAPCEAALTNAGVWEYFVFPSIDWTPKSNRVHQIIADMQLRAENVLFLDDEPANLQRALMVNPALMCSSADDMCGIIQEQLSEIPVDESCKRLKQYQELQNKVEAKKNFDSDEAFLKLADIRVSICEDCIPELDRIAELINRTNQLNFTKQRRTKEETAQLLNDSRFRCGYVVCKDKFCDYGIVGFFAVDRQKHCFEHFLFSCRTIGMGVEQFVYAQLGYPALTVIGDVVTKLEPNGCPEWIRLSEIGLNTEESQTIGSHRILMKGPCDVSQILPFFAADNLFDTEFAYVSKQKEGMYIESINHTSQILLGSSADAGTKKKLIETVPFIDEEYFGTKIFSGEYDFVVFSVLTDYGLGMYRHKTDHNLLVAFGQYTSDYTVEENWMRIVDTYVQDRPSREQIIQEFSKFSAEFEPIGRLSDDIFVENLRTIRNRMPKHTKLILLNGAERPYTGDCKESHMDRHMLHIHMNKLVKNFVDEHRENCVLIDVNDHLGSDDPYLDTINHYKKTVYYRLAGAIQQYIERCDATFRINRKHPFVLRFENAVHKVKRRASALIHRIQHVLVKNR